MKLFSRPKPEPKQAQQSPALLDLQERMERLERVVRDIRTDWESQYDKFHRLHMRIAKRQKAIEGAEEETPENRPQGTNGGQRTPNPLAQALLQRGRIG